MAKERWLPPIRCMHEWPLVLFTGLAVPGAGVYAAMLVAKAAGLAPHAPLYVHAVAAGLLAGGLAFSFLHLGQPRRAPMVLARVGRNALSTEVMLASALVVLAFAQLVPSPWRASSEATHPLLGAAAGALLVTFGLVYFLRARWPWRTALVAGPLVSGLAAGSVILTIVPANRALQPLALGLLAIDALLCLGAWRHGRPPGALPAHPAVDEYRRRLLLLRLVFANVLPAALIVAGFTPSAAIAVGTGALLDRFCFYGLAFVQTTEATIAEVERSITSPRAPSRP